MAETDGKQNSAETGTTKQKNTIVFKASPKQMQFLKCKKKHVAYGGARGGGKSWVLRLKACLLCNRWKGIRILIVRRTLEDVRKNHIIPLKKLLGNLARFKQTDRTFYFRNGSVIEFQYYDNEKDETHFRGNEWDVIFIDEATQFEEEWLKTIAACCRGGPEGYPKRVYYTCNPGGPGHAYIKRLFVDRKFEKDENPEDYEFIQSLVTDNKYLMRTQPEYVNFLKVLPPKLKAAWLYGRWDIFEGQFFEDLRTEPDIRAAAEAGEPDPDPEELKKAHRWTHVIEPFAPRRHWPIYRSFDWGYHRPFSMGYYTVDDDSVLYRICEFYGVQHAEGKAIPNEGVKWAPERVFAEIQRFEREHPYLAGREIQGIADPAIWDAESGISYAETAAKYGIYFTKADNKRIPGWMQCHYRLQFDDSGYAQFYVFENCTEFIRTIPTLQYDKYRDEDLDSSGEDHIADEWRYMCQGRPITPVIVQEKFKPAWGSDPLEQFGQY